MYHPDDFKNSTNEQKAILGSEASAESKLDLSGFPGADALNWFEDTILASPDTIRCCLHEQPRTFMWCQENCDMQSSCDTYAWADDEAKLLDGEAWICKNCGIIYSYDGEHDEGDCPACKNRGSEL